MPDIKIDFYKKNLLLQIRLLLPTDIVCIIYNYLISYIRSLLQKSEYIKLIPYISSQKYNSYTRFIIKNDYDFVFSKLMDQNWINWSKTTKYFYNNNTFNNYVQFINTYAIKNNSQKIRKKLMEYNKNRVNKKPKKTSQRTIKWNN